MPEILAFHQSTNVLLRAYVSSEKIEMFLSRSDWPPPEAFKKAEEMTSARSVSGFWSALEYPKDLSIHQITVN